MKGHPISEAGIASLGFDGPLPDAVDVAIIGGGIIGVMTAWFLAEAGQRVAILEKGRIAGEQSSRNWGWIRAQGRDHAELPIMIEANRLWRGLSDGLRADIGLRQTGVLYLADSERKLLEYERWLPQAQAHRLDTRMVTPTEVAAMMPGAARRWLGGLWTASDLRAEAFVAVPVIARVLADRGVTIREACAVRGFDMTAGRVSGVVTEAGLVRAGRVVLAGGAWSALMLRRFGVMIPQLSVKATVANTAPLENVFDGAAHDAALAWRRREDRGYTLAGADLREFYVGPDAFRHFFRYLPEVTREPLSNRLLPGPPAGFPDGWTTERRWALDGVSPFERQRILDPKPSRRLVSRLERRFAERFPEAGHVRAVRAWAGMIDTMPDVVPVVDHAPALPGLTIATGMSGHGFGIGPGMGRVVADLVMGRPPGHDLSRFRFGRFSDGSTPEVGPAL